ncbi:MAG TPA: alpha/beta hydrolase [Pseudonocardiaceae bacterium]
MHETVRDWRPPSRVLRDLEVPRAIGELAAYYAGRPVARFAPRGDGHGVLVLPGFLATDLSTRPLRAFLRRLGYDARPWRLGRNLGPIDIVLDGLPQRLRELQATTGVPVSLVGVSLGGSYARELARAHSELVRQVITLGSPFRLPIRYTGRPLTHAEGIYRAFESRYSRRLLDQPEEYDLPPLPVPATAIYTRTDGVVPWQACLEREGPSSESVEVWGSHSGLGHNPLALAVIADRLAQPPGSWRGFRHPPPWGRWRPAA